MSTINATFARDNFYKIISEVNNGFNPITIVNSRGKNAVLISEDDWNDISETIHLNSIPGLAESIIEGRRENIKDCTLYNENEEW